MRKALLIGINKYPNGYELSGCINDINILEPLLQRNGNGDCLFDVKKLIDVQSSEEAMHDIDKLFKGDQELSLLYFSGHGYANATGAELVFPNDIENGNSYHKGIKMSDIMEKVYSSQVKNKVIILDCCHSGGMGKLSINSHESQLYPGVTILSACREEESAIEDGYNGVFTKLFCNALNGEAADVSGVITLGSTYTYIDRMFGEWEQRPIFKTNVSSFIPFRTVQPRVSKDILREITSFFVHIDDQYKLDPSFEYTNSPQYSEYYKNRDPLATDEHVEIFKKLQKLQKIGLVEPVGEEYMYWAAIHSKACRLTDLGKHYWQLVKKERL